MTCKQSKCQTVFVTSFSQIVLPIIKKRKQGESHLPISFHFTPPFLGNKIKCILAISCGKTCLSRITFEEQKKGKTRQHTFGSKLREKGYTDSVWIITFLPFLLSHKTYALSPFSLIKHQLKNTYQNDKY